MATATTTKRKPRANKPEGQWKIDGKEPLNNDEAIKQDDGGLSAKQRVIDIYSKQGFSSIPPEDLAPRFKWLGLYTQRNQNLGGEMTAKLSNAELQDEYFMMRVRFDGGRADPAKLRAVGEISRDYARSTADFTDRQNIQLHWIQIEDVPTIWDKLESVGLGTLMGCGDVPRVILGSPVAGVAEVKLSMPPQPSKRLRIITYRARSSTTFPASSKPPFPAMRARTLRTKSKTLPL